MSCICCNSKDEENLHTIRLSEDNGFCSQSYSEEICWDCYDKNIITIKTGEFLKLPKGLYFKHHINGCYELIRSEEEIDRIFNPQYYEVLNMFYEINNR